MNITQLATEGSSLIQQELGFVSLLFVASIVAIIVRRIRLPYTVALVVVGLVLSFFPNFLRFSVSSDLILGILVPPLLFEATLHIKWNKLRNDLGSVTLLAIVGTLIGTFMVGGIVHMVLNIPLVAAIAFGALISATDPIAVIAFFRTLGVSQRLSLLVEGESLVNDGVSIVVFNLAIAAAATVGGTVAPSLSNAVLEFLRVALGGLGVGLTLGYAVSYLILQNLDDHLIETATTVVLAFGSFVIAEEFHLSGILAVVAAGLMVGNIGLQSTTPTTRITLENFWEFLAFAVNSLIFLLIGLEIDLTQLLPNIGAIIIAIGAILLSRAVIIYGLNYLHSRLDARRRVPVPYRHVMYWGGLRGAISLALALTLTGKVLGTAVAQELRVMTFGVVLFTLLIQGTSIQRLIRRLKLADKPPQREEQQRRQALLYAKQAGRHELGRMQKDGLYFPDVWESMAMVYDKEINHYKLALSEHLQKYPELEQEIYIQARADVLKAERSAITDAMRRGFISEEMYVELIRNADNHSAALDLIRANLINNRELTSTIGEESE
ncbi:MAG: Na+/H+ antiporter [Anaerolineae bacterium]